MLPFTKVPLIMKKLLLALTLATAATLSLSAVTAPTISYQPYAKVFRVDFPGGGFVYACTEFKSLVETIEQDGKTVPYNPRKCGPFEAGPEQEAYEDDWSFIQPNGGKWEVWSELQREDALMVKTNTLTVEY